MTKTTLNFIKIITNWLGVCVTFLGIGLNFAYTGNWWPGALSLLGLFITCIGHWANSRIAKIQKAEKDADRDLIDDLHARIEYSEEQFNDPDLKRIIKREALRYADEHQDD